MTDSIKRENFTLISSPSALIAQVSQLEINDDLTEISLYSEIPIQELLQSSFKIVKAAGGLVFREDGDLLFIKRFGMWDLPKGKLHKSESNRFGAIREVTEETGLSPLKITEKAGTTYHIYHHKGRYQLKETTWYTMAYTGNQIPVPQLEESITEVQWFGKQDYQEIVKNTYRSLKDLIESYLLNNKE